MGGVGHRIAPCSCWEKAGEEKSSHGEEKAAFCEGGEYVRPAARLHAALSVSVSLLTACATEKYTCFFLLALAKSA